MNYKWSKPGINNNYLKINCKLPEYGIDLRVDNNLLMSIVTVSLKYFLKQLFVKIYLTFVNSKLLRIGHAN